MDLKLNLACNRKIICFSFAKVSFVKKCNPIFAAKAADTFKNAQQRSFLWVVFM